MDVYTYIHRYQIYDIFYSIIHVHVLDSGTVHILCCRQTWQEEKAKLLSHIEEEEMRVKGLMNDIEVEKIRSKKVNYLYVQ